MNNENKTPIEETAETAVEETVTEETAEVAAEETVAEEKKQFRRSTAQIALRQNSNAPDRCGRSIDHPFKRGIVGCCQPFPISA